MLSSVDSFVETAEECVRFSAAFAKGDRSSDRATADQLRVLDFRKWPKIRSLISFAAGTFNP